MDDFTVIGRIVVDSSGAASIQTLDENLQEVETTSGGLGEVFSNLGGVADYVFGQVIVKAAFMAINAVKQFIGDSIQAASKHEDVMAQFNNQLGNYTAGTKRSGDQISAMLMTQAQAWSDVTRFSKDSIVAGESVLMTYSKIGADVLPQAIAATSDLAAKMGVDFPAAAALTGKALGDPVMGVGRLNQQFKLFEPTQLKAIEYMAAHGKVAQAQTAILDALQAKIGGTAQAMGETFAGKMDILNNKFEEMKIAVGSALIPALSNMLDALSPVIDAALPALTSIITGVVIPALNGLVNILTFLAGKAGELWDAFKKSLEPLGKLAESAYAAIKPALDNITTAVQGFWNQLFDPGTAAAGEAAGKVKRMVSQALKTGDITPDEAQKMQPEKLVPDDFGTRLTKAISKYGPDIVAGFNSLMSAGGAWIGSTGWPIIQTGLAVIGQKLINWLSNRASDFVAGVTPWIQGMADKIQGAWSTLVSSFNTIGTNISGWFTENIQTFVGHGKDIVDSILAGISDNIDPIVQQIQTSAGTWIQALVNAGTQFVDQGAGIVANILAGIVQNVNNILVEINPDVDKWVKAIGDKLKDFISVGSNIITSIVKGISDSAGQVEAKLMFIVWQAIENIKKQLGIASPSKVFLEIGTQIPAGLAQGIQSAAQLALTATNNMVGGVVGAANSGFANNTNYNQRTTNNYYFGANLYGSSNSPASDLTQAFRK